MEIVRKISRRGASDQSIAASGVKGCFRFERSVLKAILAGSRSLRSLPLTLRNLSGMPSHTGPSLYAFCHRELLDRPERRIPGLNVSAGWLGLPARSAERSRTHPQPLNVIVTRFGLNFATSGRSSFDPAAARSGVQAFPHASLVWRRGERGALFAEF